MQGVKVVTNQMGVIQDIQYNEKERSSNIFSKLPFYETIACKNMYVSISITGDNSIWERLTVVGINFFLLGFVILMIARTASVISHWMGEKSFSVRTSVKVLMQPRASTNVRRVRKTASMPQPKRLSGAFIPKQYTTGVEEKQKEVSEYQRKYVHSM